MELESSLKFGKLYLFMVYPKNTQVDLSEKEKACSGLIIGDTDLRGFCRIKAEPGNILFFYNVTC